MGLRLEAGRPYSFLIQVDYDMGYFFGQASGSTSGTGQGAQPIDAAGAGRLEWCVSLSYLCVSLFGLVCQAELAAYWAQGAVATVGSERHSAVRDNRSTTSRCSRAITRADGLCTWLSHPHTWQN